MNYVVLTVVLVLVAEVLVVIKFSKY